MKHRAPRALLGLSVALLVGCDLGACGAPPVAVVSRVEGAVALATAAAPERWAAAAEDAELAMGDAIRTGERSTAQLTLDDGSVIDLEPNSTLRLLLDAPGEAFPRLDLLAGAVVIATAEGTDIAARGGRAYLAAGSRVELRRADGRLAVTLTVGRARLADDDGGERELTLGEAITLVEAAHADDGVVATAGGVLVTRPSDEGSPGAPLGRVEDGSLALSPPDDALGYADLSVGAGRDLVVRDTLPPTAIEVGFGEDCAAGAVVERLAGRVGGRVAAAGRGTSSVSLAFPAGSHRYQVRCLVDGEPRGRPVARGRVKVVRSSGQGPLPRSAPESRVDADGRRYTVLYQNLLPSITVRWPGGASGPTTLVVRSRGATRRVALHGPEHRFAPGELGEGAHSLHFEAASGGRRSRETTVRVRFDETAASASLVEPETGSFAPGQAVRVSGTALAGWRVVAGDREIPVGRDQRFEGQALVPANGALVVQLSKPGRGVHYYVRRARAGAGGS